MRSENVELTAFHSLATNVVTLWISWSIWPRMSRDATYVTWRGALTLRPTNVRLTELDPRLRNRHTARPHHHHHHHQHIVLPFARSFSCDWQLVDSCRRRSVVRSFSVSWSYLKNWARQTHSHYGTLLGSWHPIQNPPVGTSPGQIFWFQLKYVQILIRPSVLHNVRSQLLSTKHKLMYMVD